MGSIGIDKLLLIGIALLIFFGPSKLPELGKALGKGIQEFKKASREFSAAVKDPGSEEDKKG
jgi:sec-independent protein translocase protein TatA